MAKSLRLHKRSGVPVGTAYHWYILAHQNVTKLDANDYKRADKDKWSATMSTQRKHLITFLKEMITQMEHEPVSADEIEKWYAKQ